MDDQAALDHEQDHQGSHVTARQLWRTEGPDPILVWVEAVNEALGMATVLAAATEVGAADHTSLIVACADLGGDLAIYTSVCGWVSTAVLGTRVATVEVHDEIVELRRRTEQRRPGASRCGVEGPLRVGPRLRGCDDPRRLFRQQLACRLDDLNPHEDADG